MTLETVSVLALDVSPAHSGWVLSELDLGAGKVLTRMFGCATASAALARRWRGLEEVVIAHVHAKDVEKAFPGKVPAEVWQAIRMQRHVRVLSHLIGQWRPDYVALEEPVYAATNRSGADAGGINWAVRLEAMRARARVRLHNAPSLKIAGAGKGNATKDEMVAAARPHLAFDPDDLVVRSKTSGKVTDANAAEDICDAFHLNELLCNELLVRAGVRTLRDLDEGTRRVFLRTTKANPVNLLDRPFVGDVGPGLGGREAA